MKKIFVFIVCVIALSLHGSAQSVWDRTHLEDVRTQIDRPMYAAAYDALIHDADSLLDVEAYSVMMKPEAGASGDKHDYTSLARYFHPDPQSADGLPYVNRDGITNPEIGRWDRLRLGETARRVTDLSLAWFFSGDERYAAKAAELLRVWFLNPATRMNPHFKYAQMVPGVNGGKGRSFGVLDGYSFVEMLDAVALLETSESWTGKDDRKLKKWMASLLDWMLTSPEGREESAQANNHSTAYDAQAIAIALYTGREDVARELLAGFAARRIFTQIEPDGRQPHEMWRTLSFGYSLYNLTHITDVLLMAKKSGMNIYSAADDEGRSYGAALDFMASFIGKSAEEWPGQQIEGWEDKQQELARELWRAGAAVDTARADCRALYRAHRVFRPSERFTLTYYVADDVDDAFTRASACLRQAIRFTRKARLADNNRCGHRLNPRSLNQDSTLVLVHPHDWTSGFFPGELWLMYSFTNDPFWRREAFSFTWDIEESKRHGGTHDLGFMIGNSFGKAWELTGEQSSLDVVHEAASTLCTRFNPAVGAIRSWDHNPQQWQYPVIIDNMMNLEMLFKMSEATGDRRFRDIAVSHADVTLKNHFRDDFSSFHVVDYDAASGAVRMRVTAQGYADDSYWSRGQAWAIYGYTMCYRHTHFRRYLDRATAVADWFMALRGMPTDHIPYWDMKAPGTDVADNREVPRDASAAAIIASALYELAGYAGTERADRYIAYADDIIASLGIAYTLSPEEGAGFILGHSTGHLPAGSEIDVPLVYADYYYLEALLRKRKTQDYK